MAFFYYPLQQGDIFELSPGMRFYSNEHQLYSDAPTTALPEHVAIYAVIEVAHKPYHRILVSEPNSVRMVKSERLLDGHKLGSGETITFFEEPFTKLYPSGVANNLYTPVLRNIREDVIERERSIEMLRDVCELIVEIGRARTVKLLQRLADNAGTMSPTLISEICHQTVPDDLEPLSG